MSRRIRGNRRDMKRYLMLDLALATLTGLPSARAMARSSLQAWARAGVALTWVLSDCRSCIGVVDSVGTRASYLSWVILPSLALAESSQPSRVPNELRNSPPPAAMSRLRSRKFTSTNAACSFSDFRTPPEVQLEVPEVMPKVWLPKAPLVVAARICLIMLLSFW